MRQSAAVCFVLSLLVPATVSAAAAYRAIPVRVEPPQRVGAITLKSGERTVPVTVEDGVANVPADLSLPWTIVLNRFEPTVYTDMDLRASRPLLVRELGRLAGSINEGGRPIRREYTILIRSNGSKQVGETKFAAGEFAMTLPAGMYQAAVVSETCGSRLRSGIMIKPGFTTNLASIACEPTISVSFRAIDAKTGTPVRNAKIVWDPPAALNAQDARVMYSHRWTAVTNRLGAVTFRVGPLPIPLQWRVEAEGYAAERSARTEVFDSKRLLLPDVLLRASTILKVRVHLPRDDDDFRGGSVVLGELQEAHSTSYVAVARARLRDGEIPFRIESFGQKRVWIENAAGTKLVYRDLRVEPETAFVDLTPEEIEIHGAVSRRGTPIENVTITLADPHDAHVILRRTKSASDGTYSLNTYQTGELFLYTTGSDRPGSATGSTSRKIVVNDARDYRADFDLPDEGASVVVTDSSTGAPVPARVETHITVENGGRQIVRVIETDDAGRLSLSGFPEGTARLDISAKGYRTQQVDLPLKADDDTMQIVKLVRSKPLSGIVMDSGGAPVFGALISAGFDDELAMQAHLETASDAEGRFHFDSPPAPGEPFYIVAAGRALSIATLNPDVENVVTLSPPGTGLLYLTEDNAPPQKMYRVMTAVSGQNYVPLAVLEDLAEANGMTMYQLLGSGRDGAVVLPEFLSAGSYDFFITRKNGRALVYERVGTLTVPTTQPVILRIPR